MGQQPKVVGLSSVPCILKQSIQTCCRIMLHISHNFMKTSLIRVEQERKKERNEDMRLYTGEPRQNLGFQPWSSVKDVTCLMSKEARYASA